MAKRLVRIDRYGSILATEVGVMYVQLGRICIGFHPS